MTDNPLREERVQIATDFGWGVGVIREFIPPRFAWARVFCGSQNGGTLNWSQTQKFSRILAKLADGGNFTSGELVLLASLKWWSPVAPCAEVYRLVRTRTHPRGKFGAVYRDGPSPLVIPIADMPDVLARVHLECISLMETGPVQPFPPPPLRFLG